MGIYFGSQTKHDYTLVDELPKKGDIRTTKEGFKQECTLVKPAFYGFKYPDEENYKEYNAYLVSWEPLDDDGWSDDERICVRKNEYPL